MSKYYYPYKGGIETVVRSLAEGFVREKDDVTVICSNTVLKRSEEEVKGVQVLRLPQVGVVASQPLTLSVKSELAMRSSSFDVIHYHAPNPLIETQSLRLQPTAHEVVTYHSDIVKQKFLGRLYKPLLKSFLKKMKRIIVASEEAIEFSPILPEFREKCVVIPFGISDKPFQKTETIAELVKENFNIFGEYFLFTGRLVGYKGLDVLLHSFKATQSNLVIVGQGELESDLKNLAKELGIDDRVFFLGNVQSSEQFVSLFYGCKALVLPSVSRAEAFGMVMIEAMACGKPVVSTLLDSGVRSVNKHEESGLQVAPSDVQALANAIEQLEEDSELCKKLGEGARRRFDEKFSLERMIQSYRGVYESL